MSLIASVFQSSLTCSTNTDQQGAIIANQKQHMLWKTSDSVLFSLHIYRVHDGAELSQTLEILPRIG